ncbi:GTPase Der [Populus alba x Populus x berolinensis]|nr:GTPase Der [Populus alba x Populus x berolinensis]
MSHSWVRALSSRKRHYGVGILHRSISSSSGCCCSHFSKVNNENNTLFTVSFRSLFNNANIINGNALIPLDLKCCPLAPRWHHYRGYGSVVQQKMPELVSGSGEDVTSSDLEQLNFCSDDGGTDKKVKVVYEKPIDFTKIDMNLLPTVIIVGRPNVGKSALYNRLIRRREALVYNTPDDHVTRDIREGVAKLGDLRFKVLDSAGLETEAASGSILQRTTSMTANVLARTQFAVFLIDVRAGLHPLDLDVGRWFRKHAPGIKPIVAMNKSESLCDGVGSISDAADEARMLGFGDPIAISAEMGLGMAALHDALQPLIEDYMLQVLNNNCDQDNGYGPSHVDDVAGEVDESKLPLQLAIIGRPNVGKSTLLNTLLQEERVLVGPEVGLTRDSVRTQFQYEGRTIYLVDTAGWLQRTGLEKGPSSLSVMQSRKNLMRAQVVALVLDAEEVVKARRSMTHAEVVIARRAVEEGRGLVVIVNKMDLLKGKQNSTLFDKVMEAVPLEIQTVIPQITGIPVVFTSALEGRGRIAVMRQVIDTYEKWCSRLSTSRLNRWLRKVMSRHSWKDQAAQPKIKYFTQVKARPPTFVAFTSGKTQLSDTDLRFLTKSLKEDFDLGGIPIRIMQRCVPRKGDGSRSKSTPSAGRMAERFLSDKRTADV